VQDFLEIQEGVRVRLAALEKARIFNQVCRDPGTTRTAMIHSLGLRPTSVSQAVKQLIASGLVEENRGAAGGRQGRPVISLFPARNRFVCMAVHSVSKSLRACLLNGFGDLLSSRETVIGEGDTNLDLTRKFHRLAAELRSEVPSGSEFLGIGLALPGFIDMNRRRWLMAARWPLLRGLPFGKLEKTAGSPIIVTRALDAGLEYLLASREDLHDSDVLLIHWGYGIGAAHAANGKVLSSSVGGVCEIGHSRMATDSRKACRCGSTGCLETTAALWSILPALRRDFPEVPEDESLFGAYLNHHPAMARHAVISRAIADMARGISLLYVTLFPRHVLLYGPLTVSAAIRRDIHRSALEHIPEFARAYFSLRFIDPDFKGELYGGTRAFFLHAYRASLGLTG
jgi:predicted NBD/HSP70 family sugar kinase